MLTIYTGWAWLYIALVFDLDLFSLSRFIDRSDLVEFEFADGTVVAGFFTPFLDASNTKLVVAAFDACKLSWLGLLHTDDAVGMR